MYSCYYNNSSLHLGFIWIATTISTSLNSSIPIGKTIETHQLKAHHHAELAAEHERFIREMELHKKTVVRHAHALGQIFGVDSRLSSEMNVNSPKIVSGIWDEVL